MITSDFTKQEYSKQDFLRLIEHRIRKEIRAHHLLDTKKSYVFEEKDSLQSKVLAYFLQQIFENRLHVGSKGEVLDSDYLELYVSKRLNVFLNAGDVDVLKQECVAPLRSVTQHEIKEVASILGLEGELTLVKQSIIDELATKYPQTKPSFLKSFLHIEKL